MEHLRRFFQSVSYAWAGIVHAVKTQRNMRIHLTVTTFVLLAAWGLEVPRTDVLLLFFSIALVLSLELMNTALEAAVDLVTQEKHPLAKVAKDAGAGAVLVAAIISVIIGLVILGPPLWDRLREWM